MIVSSKEWFCDWFNTKYYHLLYKNRDEKEAELFLDNLISYLKPKKEAKIVDVACGKGRHSIYLNKKGFQVTGIDISKESIHYAQKFENNTLSFYLHDMRNLFQINYFDYAFNLFTSFGYFNKENDNNKAIRAIAKSLKPGGLFILDYFNTTKIMHNLIHEEEKKIEHITFFIKRKIEGRFIKKNISFTDNQKEYAFEEKVNLLYLEDFKKYFSENQLIIKDLLGSYQLEPFDPINSDRLIIIAQKN